MRRYNEPIDVEVDQGDFPRQVTWRNKRFCVCRTLERWRWAGKWWLLGTPQIRHYYRVEVRYLSRYDLPYRDRVIEIYRQGKNWVLARLCD